MIVCLNDEGDPDQGSDSQGKGISEGFHPVVGMNKTVTSYSETNTVCTLQE